MADFALFEKKMKAAGSPDLAIRTFRYYYGQLVSGGQGMLSRKEIGPVDDVPAAADIGLTIEKTGKEALQKTAVIKLNGGLGTSMGMQQAKSLLTVKEGLTFLDIIACQNLRFREQYKCSLPLVFMDSFITAADTLAFLKKYPDLTGPVPLDFVQHRVPKILEDTLEPADWPADPDLEWCPPGHGDIYTALVTSGMLDILLDQGCRYAFMSNADNLGAIMDTAILGYFASAELPFMMEVTTRMEADKKGGHLARMTDGRLALRETAQTPDEEREEFEDVSTYRYFNTNNLWLNLDALKQMMEEKDQIPGLTMIRNRKHLDPRDPASPGVIQLETAMGAAISVFSGAQALAVPRERFAPVKKCSDLLGLWSDAYILNDDLRVVPDPRRDLKPPAISLDDRYYKLIDDMQDRFPAGPPHLAECTRLTVTGDVRFGREVTIKGDVSISNNGTDQYTVPDNSVIDLDLTI